MDVPGAFALAAAIAFCDREPDAALCRERVIAPIEMTDDARRTLDNLHRRAHNNAGYEHETRDRWEIKNPDDPGDWEDRVLWALEYLARYKSGIFGAARIVLMIDGEGRPIPARVVAVIETTSGSIIFDPSDRDGLRPWGDENRESFSPLSSLRGTWARYRGVNGQQSE